MNTFPQEILHKIFINLPLIDKQECMMVCRSWRDILYTRSLFQSVIISDGNITLLSKFMEMVKRSPHLGAQVQYLKIPTGFKDDFDKSNLLYFLPNLNVLRSEILVHLGSDHNQICELKTDQFDQASLPSQMKHIEELGNLEMTRLLVSYGLGSHLVRLQLKLIHFSVPLLLDDVAPQLTNLPSLKTLEILTYYITINNCETLHANIPSLRSLYLKNSDPTYVETELHRRRAIEPAPLVTSFALHMTNLNITNQNSWFLYIQKKYPHLEAFGFSVPLLSYEKELAIHYHQVNLPVILQRLGPQLSSLRLLDVDVDTTVFNKLDLFGCKIKHLTLDYVKKSVTDALCQSNQMDYIEHLQINTLSSESLDWLRNMKKLKTLSFKSMEVEFENQVDTIREVRIKLEALLQSCPETLESIDVSGLCLNCDAETAQRQQRQLSVKKLILNRIGNAEGINTLILNYLPHLKYLTLFNSQGTLSFPNHHFDYVKVFNKPFSSKMNVTLRTLIDDKNRYYSTSDVRSRVGYSQLDEYIVPLPDGNFDDGEHVNIVCGSLKVLEVGDLKAYLV